MVLSSPAALSTMTMAQSKGKGKGKRGAPLNPFKEEEEGCGHYAKLFIAAILLTGALLFISDQGRQDAKNFHQHHIAKHLRYLKTYGRRHSHGAGDKHFQQHNHDHNHHHQQYHVTGGKSSASHRNLDNEHQANNKPGHHQDHQEKQHEKKHGEHHHHHQLQYLDSHHKHHDVIARHDEAAFGESNKILNAVEYGEFLELTAEEFPEWLHAYYQHLDWSHGENKKAKHLTYKILAKSLELGCMNMVANQKEAGNFNYQYDFVTGHLDETDSQVRQAGALWGLALCFQHMPDNEVLREAVEKGLDFFMDHMKVGHHETSLFVVYPGERLSDTGTNALVGLAMIEYLRTVRVNHLSIPVSQTREMETKLGGILEFLLHQQNHDHHFASHWVIEEENKNHFPSPYFDGEALLCLIKAAKYMHWEKNRLVPIIEETAPVLAKAYMIEAWKNDKHDSDATKGFYQWSSMAFAEYYDAKWKDAELFGDYVLSLAHWVIHTHRILHRTRNTGYAYEGLIAAYQVAVARGEQDAAAARALQVSIDEGLHKISTWQVGGPLAKENEFLSKHPTKDHRAIGGVMNAKDQSPLRIDTVQHQMHAVIMALNTLYKPQGSRSKDVHHPVSGMR